MAGRRVKISDIARQAGVSATTVSHIFNGRARQYRIAESTRQRVLTIAGQYREQLHIQRAIIKANSTRTIGVIVPDMSNFSFAIFLHKLESLARANGIQLLIACSHYDRQQEISVVHNLLERKVDGLIIISSLENDSLYQQINPTTPILLYDRYIQNSTLPFVTSESVETVANLIAQKAVQFDEFWFLGGDSELSSINERLQGFKLGLKKAGRQLDPQWIVCDSYRENLGFHLMENIHRRIGRLPQAVFTPSGNLLEGVLLYLTNHNVARQDIYLCTYDYNQYLNYLAYDIDIISQNYDEMASCCFNNIQRLINRFSLPNQAVYIKPQILPAKKASRKASGSQS